MSKNVFFALVLTAGLALPSCSKDVIGYPPEEENNDTTVIADDSAGDKIDTDKSDDNVANSTFNRTVKVIFNGSSASVTGASDNFTVAVSGAGVTITNKGDESVIYELSGSSSDGYFKLYSSRKQEILLNGLTLTNKKGASMKRT